MLQEVMKSLYICVITVYISMMGRFSYSYWLEQLAKALFYVYLSTFVPSGNGAVVHHFQMVAYPVIIKKN